MESARAMIFVPMLFFLFTGGLLLCLLVWAVNSRQLSASHRETKTQISKQQNPSDRLWQREIMLRDQLQSEVTQRILRTSTADDIKLDAEYETLKMALQLSWLNLYLTIGRQLAGKEAPGASLNSIAQFFCSRKTMEKVVEPAISDMQEEFSEAWHENRKVKAVWVCIMGGWSFFKASSLHTLKKNLATIRRLAGMG